jgi:hypothetical protein
MSFSITVVTKRIAPPPQKKRKDPVDPKPAADNERKYSNDNLYSTNIRAVTKK